jgi:hypothetical protein
MSETQFRLEPQFPDEPGAFSEVAQREAQIIPQEEIPLSAEAITLAGIMGRIQARLEAEMQKMESAGVALAQVVTGINPTDQATYTELCERVEDTKQFIKGADEFIEPWKKLFYRPYQAVLERQKRIVGAPTSAVATGTQRRLAFERVVREAAERETMRLQKEQRDHEEKQRLDNAVTAEQMGLSEHAVETILTAPSVAPTPVAAPMISRPQGVRKIPPNWKAELESEEKFWQWARAQKKMPPVIRAGMEEFQKVMDRESKTHRTSLGNTFPGWRGVNKGGD